MQISVTPELENEIKKQLDSGEYENTEDLICDALRSKLIDEAQQAFIISRKSITEQELVFSRIQESIYREDLKPGDKLLSVRRLSEILLVSVSSVEDAIRKLISSNYLEVREGQGIFIKDNSTQKNNCHFSCVTYPHLNSLNDLLEVRAGLEGQGVVMAVERATFEDIKRLKEALSKIPANRQDMSSARDADMNFHINIAYATHNLVYIDLIKKFYEQMFEEINALHSLLYETPFNLEIIEKHHFKILGAIIQKDKEGARRHMLQHIVFIKSFIKKHYPVIDAANKNGDTIL